MDLEEGNRTKYGDKSNDVIAQAFTLKTDYGYFWCVFNAIKYLSRFIRPGSIKGMQLIDLKKARDYIDRAIEQMEKDPNLTKDVETKD